MSENKTYLGDGAYCIYNSDYDVILYTSNGIQVTNEIYLTSEMVKNLNDFIQKNINKKGVKENGK